MSIILQECNKQKKAVLFNITPELRQVHRDYGLWIFFATRFSCRYQKTHTKPIPRYFNFYNISHLLDGKGWLWTRKDGIKDFPAGHGVTMTPGTIHDYNAYDHYDEDFLCFGGPVADHLARTGIIRPGTLHIGAARRLLPIIDLANDPSHDSQIMAALQLQNLLVALYMEHRSGAENPHYEAISSLISMIRSAPEKWWSVNDMAETVNLSTNQFMRVFFKATGMTPKKYCENYKLQLAAEQLRTCRESIGNIALSLGYRDQFHFCKRFRLFSGFSPSEYRRKAPKNFSMNTTEKL